MTNDQTIEGDSFWLLTKDQTIGLPQDGQYDHGQKTHDTMVILTIQNFVLLYWSTSTRSSGGRDRCTRTPVQGALLVQNMHAWCRTADLLNFSTCVHTAVYTTVYASVFGVLHIRTCTRLKLHGTPKGTKGDQLKIDSTGSCQ